MVWKIPLTSQTGTIILTDDDDLYITEGVTVAVPSGNAVYSSGGSNHDVRVFGSIVSSVDALIIGNDADLGNRIFIGATGHVEILDDGFAVTLRGNGATLENRGLIRGVGAGVYLGGGTVKDTVVVNTGTIEATDTAVLRNAMDPTTLVLTNSGVISGEFAFNTNEVPGSSVDKITNIGTMIGTIDLSGGDDFYDGSLGHVQGTVLGGAGVDTLLGGSENNVFDGGTGTDIMDGGSGNDTFYVDAGDKITEAANGGTDTVLASKSYVLTAGTAVEKVAAIDVLAKTTLYLTGNELNQTVSGNVGVNQLNGGAGTDQLVGYGGNDTFPFNSKLGPTNIDRIADFHNVSGDNDVFNLENAIFTKLTATGAFTSDANFAHNSDGLAKKPTDTIVYDTDDGRLLYDADGNGTGAAVQFAVLTDHPALTFADFFVV